MNDHESCNRCELWGDENIHTPNLSELIEACGTQFRRLTLHHNKVVKPSHIEKYGEDVKWQANPNQHLSKVKSQWGKTPEESVAKLWLLLNEKPKL